MTDPITSLRSRLKQTGASQAEQDALEALVVARDELVTALKSAVLQIEYLHAKFKPTGSGNGCIWQSNSALSKHKSAE
jgi:hypothetical protein